MKKREEIDNKYKIDLSEMFASDEEFLREVETLNKEILKVKDYQGHILDSADSLLELLDLIDGFDMRIDKVHLYAHINNDCDLEVQKYNEFIGKSFKLYNVYSSLCSYIVPEITSASYDLIDDYIKENPKLKKYERMLKDLFRLKKYTLSAKEEYIISRLSEALDLPEKAYSKLTDVDLKFEDTTDENGDLVELNDSTWATLIESKNRDVRKEVFHKYHNGYKGIINSTAELLSGLVKNYNTIADIRGYETSMQSALEYNNVDQKVYDSLMKSINNNLDIIHKQWDVRKEATGLEDLHLYDTYFPMVENYEKKYTYEEAKELILSSLAPLGEDYVNTIKRSFDEKWIDVYPNKNKRGGAYCTCCYNTHPYVVTNFNGLFNDVSTITHELGHAMHYYYAQNNQEYVDYNYSIFVAEVASQVNEILLALYVLNNTDDLDEKAYMLDILLKHFKSSTVRQSMFAEFEKLIYEKEQNGEVLTYQLLCDEYYKLNKKYFGDNIEVDEDIQYEWSRIPHFYYHFYVYQYATGYIAALKIANDLYNGKEGALEKYLEFLKLGCTKDPVESLKIAGVDLTNPDSFDYAYNEFNNEMDSFLELIRKDKKKNGR